MLTLLFPLMSNEIKQLFILIKANDHLEDICVYDNTRHVCVSVDKTKRVIALL